MPLHVDKSRPAFAVCAVMTQIRLFEDVFLELQDEFGPIEYFGKIYRFDYTDYYNNEMGKNLHKQIAAFKNFREPHCLAEIKKRTLAIEERWATSDTAANLRRRANIDPGILSESTLLLATTKYGRHRVGIAPGMYAEITLMYEKGRYRKQPWTYIDYQSEEMQSFLLTLRTDLLTRRRSNVEH